MSDSVERPPRAADWLAAHGFMPIGKLIPGQNVALKTASDRVLFARLGEQSADEIVVECQDCPTTYDPEYGRTLKREWVWRTTAAAEQFADCHSQMLGHQVRVLYRHTFQANMLPLTPPIWELLFAPRNPWFELMMAGDCGDTVRSLAG